MEEDELYQELLELLPYSTEALQSSQPKELFSEFREKLIAMDNDPRPIPPSTKAKLVQLLSRMIHYCHREDIVNFISLAISKFKGQLRNLELEQPPMISKWPILSYKELRLQFVKLHCEKVPELHRALDEIYFSQLIVPHLEWMLRLHPEVFLSYHSVEAFVDGPTTIPTDEKLFIAIIAVSNFGSLYMWNRLVHRFFEAGGDRTWIQKGLEAVPKHIYLMSELSQTLAFCPEILVQNDNYFQNFNAVSKQYMSEAIHILCYYQSLACYAQVQGICPESEVDSSLINVKGLGMASRLSVENVYRRENSKEFDEVRTGEKMLQDYITTLQEDDDEINIGQTKRVLNALLSPNSEQQPRSWETNSFSSHEQLANLMPDNSKTLARIRMVFGKFAQFTIGTNQEQTEDLIDQLTNQVHEPNPKLRKGSNYSIVHATEWGTINTASVLADYFSEDNSITTVFSKFSQAVGRVNTLTFTKKNSKEVEYYYQFLCHYMHLHVNYKKLISEDLTPEEKFLIKLVTKSPYLLGEAGLQFFEEKEKISSIRMQDLSVMALVAVSARMEVLINIAMRNYSSWRARFSN